MCVQVCVFVLICFVFLQNNKKEETKNNLFIIVNKMSEVV